MLISMYWSMDMTSKLFRQNGSIAVKPKRLNSELQLNSNHVIFTRFTAVLDPLRAFQLFYFKN